MVNTHFDISFIGKMAAILDLAAILDFDNGSYADNLAYGVTLKSK